jgi:DNA mismatch repair protein MutS
MASTALQPVEAMPRTDSTDLDSRPPAAPGSAEFRSIVSAAGEVDLDAGREPSCFRDLNLDQLVEAVVASRQEYDLEPFFHAPLRTVDEVAYRHEVFRDLESGHVRAAVEAFAERARGVRRRLTLARKQHYGYEQQRWLLDAAVGYCQMVTALRDSLVESDLGSRGLRGWRDWLIDYTSSQRFTSLEADARRVLDGLSGVRYALRIKGLRVTVGVDEGEPDYGAEIAETFARFRQGRVDQHLLEVSDTGSMDHVEARIVERVARLHANEFKALGEFCTRHEGFVESEVARFEREVQFYLAWLELLEHVASRGVDFCYPEVSVDSKEVRAECAVDLALAEKLSRNGGRPVPNDFSLAGAERIIVVSGANQGGKTTFARMFGQLHYLAGLGLPVAARSARLFLADGVHAHFERGEDITTLRGKLEDELVRVREILDAASGESVVILNEIFASTTLDDALFLGAAVLHRILALDCLAVCVTFLDELSVLGEATVSMVAQVEPDDPSRRTFEIVRRPADGRAYAWALARRYGLSYERLRSRIGR